METKVPPIRGDTQLDSGADSARSLEQWKQQVIEARDSLEITEKNLQQQMQSLVSCASSMQRLPKQVRRSVLKCDIQALAVELITVLETDESKLPLSHDRR